MLIFLMFISFSAGISFGASTDSSTFKDYWIPALGMVGGWVSGLGTFAAVVVSLWLARKQALDDTEHVEGKFNAGTDGRDSFYLLTLVSKGKRPAKVRSVNIGGIGAEVSLYIAEWRSGSSVIPIYLNYGDDACYIFKPDFSAALEAYVIQYLEGDRSRLRIYVSTTVKTYELKAQ